MQIWWFLYEQLNIPKADHDDYNEMIVALDTPLKVQAWMYSKLKYDRFDIFDTWQPPQQTFADRRGDCEDWMLLANECLRHKYEAYPLIMIRNGSGHATYLIKHGTNKWESVGTYGKMRHTGTIPQIIPNWQKYENWTRYMLLDQDLHLIEEATNN